MKTAVVYIDDGNGDSAIVEEYRRNLSAKGQPGPGDAFLKWLLTNEWNPTRVQRVALTPFETTRTIMSSFRHRCQALPMTVRIGSSLRLPRRTRCIRTSSRRLTASGGVGANHLRGLV